MPVRVTDPDGQGADGSLVAHHEHHRKRKDSQRIRSCQDIDRRAQRAAREADLEIFDPNFFQNRTKVLVQGAVGGWSDPGVLANIRQLNGSSSGQRVPCPACDDVPPGKDLFECETLRDRGCPHREDCKVKTSILKPWKQVVHVAVDLIDANIGPGELKRCQHAGDDAVQEEWGSADTDGPGPSLAVLRQHVGTAATRLIDLAPFRREREPELGRAKRTPVRFEQGYSNALFQNRQRPAETGLRLSQHLSALGQTTFLDDGEQDLKMSGIYLHTLRL